MNLKEQRESLVKAIDATISAAKAAGRDLTSEEATDVQAKMTEVKDVDNRIKAAAEADAMLTGAPEQEKSEAVKSFGDAYVKSDAYAAVKRGHLGERFGFKAATDIHTIGELGPILDATGRDLGITTEKAKPSIFDWIKPQAISESAVRWIEEGLAEGNFEVVPEGGQKPQIHFNYEPKSDTLHTIAAFFDSTVQLVRNAPAFAARLNQRGLAKLHLDKGNLAVNAVEGTDGFNGLLNVSGLSTVTAATQAEWLDALAEAVATAESFGDFPVDGILLNSKDWSKIRLSKDAQGAYLAGSPFGGFAARSLFDVPVIVAPYIPEGTALVGSSQHITWYEENQVWVETTNSDKDKFTKNILTTRIEQDGLLVVERPAAITKVTLTAA